MFDLPVPLAQAIDTTVERFPTPDIDRQVSDLVKRYRAGGGVTHHPLDTDLAAAAYALYRMPGTYAAVRSVLTRLVATIPGVAPRSIVDLGTGTGAAAWAAAATWPDVEAMTLVDTSRPALELGRTLAHEGPPAVASAAWIETTTWATLPGADLVVVAYLLGELDPPELQATVTSALDIADVAVFVEPGTPAGYRRILGVRDSLVASGWSVAAPCPHETTCPLAGDDWCHFATRFSRPPRLRRVKQAQHGYEDEKFSYVVGARTETSPAAGRIIRHPQKRAGLVMLEVCAADGAAATVTISKRQGPLYRAGRNARWGDPWP